MKNKNLLRGIVSNLHFSPLMAATATCLFDFDVHETQTKGKQWFVHVTHSTRFKFNHVNNIRNIFFILFCYWLLAVQSVSELDRLTSLPSAGVGIQHMPNIHLTTKATDRTLQKIQVEDACTVSTTELCVRISIGFSFSFKQRKKYSTSFGWVPNKSSWLLTNNFSTKKKLWKIGLNLLLKFRMWIFRWHFHISTLVELYEGWNRQCRNKTINRGRENLDQNLILYRTCGF